MDERKSFVFPRQERNCFSRRINATAAQKLTNQNRHCHGDARFSWPKDNDLPLHYRNFLFLTLSYRDNQFFSLNAASMTVLEHSSKLEKNQDKEHFEILGSKRSSI